MYGWSSGWGLGGDYTDVQTVFSSVFSVESGLVLYILNRFLNIEILPSPTSLCP